MMCQITLMCAQLCRAALGSWCALAVLVCHLRLYCVHTGLCRAQICHGLGSTVSYTHSSTTFCSSKFSQISASEKASECVICESKNRKQPQLSLELSPRCLCNSLETRQVWAWVWGWIHMRDAIGVSTDYCAVRSHLDLRNIWQFDWCELYQFIFSIISSVILCN